MTFTLQVPEENLLPVAAHKKEPYDNGKTKQNGSNDNLSSCTRVAMRTTAPSFFCQYVFAKQS